PPGAPRLDQGTLGNIREQPASEVLRTHKKRTQAARSGTGRLGKADGGRCPGAQGGLGGHLCSAICYFAFGHCFGGKQQKQNWMRSCVSILKIWLRSM